jgi:hypothetical protein
LSEATTMHRFAGNQQWNVHVLFLFVNYLHERTSIRTKYLTQAKNSTVIQGLHS